MQPSLHMQHALLPLGSLQGALLCCEPCCALGGWAPSQHSQLPPLLALLPLQPTCMAKWRWIPACTASRAANAASPSASSLLLGCAACSAGCAYTPGSLATDDRPASLGAAALPAAAAPPLPAAASSDAGISC